MTNSSSQTNCPLCKGVAHFDREAHDAFYGVTEKVVSLYQCEQCASLFQEPIPDRAEIAEFYPQGYWQESEHRGLMARLQGTYIDWMLKADLMTWVRQVNAPAESHWLDVGCSRGDWLNLIREQGYQVAGLEADRRAADYARKTFGLTIEEVDGETWRPEPASFDVISFFHLLEHVRDPAEFLQKVHLALRSGGRILLRVPNPASLQASGFGPRWKGWEMPRHIVMFHPEALIELLERTGFVLTRRSSWSLRDGPPCAASSLFPSGEPTWQQIHRRPSGIKTLIYLGLTWCLTPIEVLASVLGRGSMLTLIAQKPTA